MEVGAVKQAFNNELIRLKKNLNQAKIQVIHKLTRKAKVLSEKKAPEKFKDKLKRKSESAVNEVLIIKKIKIRDLAKFMLTHTGELNSFLNKPKVDTDKACARLLLHKTLNDKYKLIRNRFASVPINDLLMSREERRKMKKEAKEKQKNKKKVNASTKLEMTNVEKGKQFSDDDSDVSDDEINSDSRSKDEDSINSSEVNDTDESQSTHSVKKLKSKNTIMVSTNYSDLDSDTEMFNGDKGKELIFNNSEENNNDAFKLENFEDEDEITQYSDFNQNNDDQSNDSENDNKSNSTVGKFVRLPVVKEPKNLAKISEPRDEKYEKPVQKRPKDVNKNKNLNEKLLSRKFKKETEIVLAENKVVDPFFITATGENYMSVAEPRQPDEFKEVHRQGNRKLRRAVMFGHAPKYKPRYDEYNSINWTNKPSNYHRDNSDSSYRDKTLNRSDNFKDRGFDKGERYNKVNDSVNFNKNKKMSFDRNIEPKAEKLHPSWEAKKKQSGILPFQGKKIVFEDS